MAITTSPNMLLPVPVVGQEAGPQYAIDIDSCLSLIDTHDHSPGKGVLITASGLNITTDLNINSASLRAIRSVNLTPQALFTSPTDNGSVFEASTGDLYYRNASGVNIQLTNGGSVVGAPGTISGLFPPASASYNSGSSTFVFQSASTTPANIDGASFILRNLVANSFGLTLSPPTLTSNYTITLPLLPAATGVLTIDPSGNMVSQTFNQVAQQVTLGNMSPGDVKIHMSYNGLAPIGEGWMLMDGRLINSATYDAEHGAGHWATYIVPFSSPLSSPGNGGAGTGIYLPDMTPSRYATGAATTPQTGTSPITAVGNPGNVFNNQNTVPAHQHAWYQDQHGGPNVDTTWAAGGGSQSLAFTQGVNQAHGSILTCNTSGISSVSNMFDLTGSASTILWTNEVAAVTFGSTAQSIQPDSIAFQYYMRII